MQSNNIRCSLANNEECIQLIKTKNKTKLISVMHEMTLQQFSIEFHKVLTLINFVYYHDSK